MITFDILVSLSALVILEIVLGIDNLVLLAILSEKLPREKRKKARRWGLTFAWVTRLILLASALWLSKLTHPLFTIFGLSFSGRDIFLLVGGGFLITKATQEIHNEVLSDQAIVHNDRKKTSTKFGIVVLQIAIMDIIFSLDSVLTAIGLTDNYWVMATAISIAILVMIFASEAVSAFIAKHPTIKMLALSFLILIGMVLVADSFQFHIPRGYVYFAMAFSLTVEGLNLYRRSRSQK